MYITPFSGNDYLYHSHFEKLRENFARLDENATVIIVGDYNRPKTFWRRSQDFYLEPIYGRSATSTVDDDLCDTMCVLGLSQFNHYRNLKGSILDLVMTKMPHGQVDLGVSDFPLTKIDRLYHPPLDINLKLLIPLLKEPSISRRNFRKGNFVAINSELSATDWSFIDTQSIDIATSNFYDIINNIISRHIPSVSMKNKYPEWYSYDKTSNT